jgi:Cu+-exporting ATPase
MKTESYKINGMTCAACARAVEKAVKKLDGATDVTVNLATEKLALAYDEAKIKPGDIMDAVTKAGYEAVQENNTKEIAIPIEGMTCAACAKAIERAVGKLSGVESVSVNFPTFSAQKDYI